FPIRETALALLALVLVGGLLWWSRRREPSRALPPDQRALRELERLAASIPAGGQPGAVHLRVSAVVRQYVEERFGVQAPRRTTEELLQAGRASGSITPEVLSRLESLLGECDR